MCIRVYVVRTLMFQSNHRLYCRKHMASIHANMTEIPVMLVPPTDGCLPMSTHRKNAPACVSAGVRSFVECVFVCVCVLLCVRASACACARACVSVRVCLFMCVRACVACMRCVWICVRVFVWLGTYMCGCACVRARACLATAVVPIQPQRDVNVLE